MDEGKESRIRYRVIFSVLLIILIVLVSVLGYYRIPLIIEKFSLMEHIALYMKGEDEGLSITLPRILYSASGPVKDNVQIPVLNRDTLHLAAEAALLQPDDEDLANGLVSFIPEGTSLIGISEKGGYIYIDLSEEMKDAGKRAYEEIERTIALSYPFNAIRFMIGGKLSESESLD